jgi:hypothetical protein
MAENLMNNYYLNQTPSIEEVKTDANLAFSKVKYREEHKPRGYKPPIVNDDKCVFIFKRGSGGSWVATHCICNSNLP